VRWREPNDQMWFQQYDLREIMEILRICTADPADCDACFSINQLYHIARTGPRRDVKMQLSSFWTDWMMLHHLSFPKCHPANVSHEYDWRNMGEKESI
jgi:hypothetical protein